MGTRFYGDIKTLKIFKTPKDEGFDKEILIKMFDGNDLVVYDNKYIDVNINELGLSPRSFNGLMRNNVRTIRELVKFESAEDLLKLKSVGKTCVEEIYKELDKWQQEIIKEKKVA